MGKAWLQRAPLVNAGTQAAQGNFQAVEAFRVADDEESIRNEKVAQLVHQPLLRRAVKIDHHVAAKNKWERLGMMVALDQVDLMKSHPFRDVALDPVVPFPLAAAFLKVFVKPFA